ncbi:hypothetical protein LX36DRAFT_724094 [Colletotrichum falcatum]|nr:hypothetical protein LX36DRAFT_724094 [Colletotrichum falcatum]
MRARQTLREEHVHIFQDPDTAAGTRAPLVIENFSDGETVHTKCIIIKGRQLSSDAWNDFITISSSDGTAKMFQTQTWPLEAQPRRRVARHDGQPPGVAECLRDTRAPGRTVGNDNGECDSFWEACCVGQGAFLHEVGHAFGAPHTTGIMARGYPRYWAHREIIRSSSPNLEEPYKKVFYGRKELEGRFDPEEDLKVYALGVNGKTKTVRNLWRALASCEPVRIPGSYVVLRKRSVTSKQLEDSDGVDDNYFDGLVEFGVITAPKGVELPDQVYGMKELQNTDGCLSAEELRGDQDEDEDEDMDWE